MQVTIWNVILGALGGFVGEIVREKGCIYLPRLKDHRVYLNSLTGIVLGIVSGVIGDGDPANAFMWGTGGSWIIPGMVMARERLSSSPNCTPGGENGTEQHRSK